MKLTPETSWRVSPSPQVLVLGLIYGAYAVSLVVKRNGAFWGPELAATGALGLCCATITTITHATPIAPHEHKMRTCERRPPRTCATRTLAVIL